MFAEVALAAGITEEMGDILLRHCAGHHIEPAHESPSIVKLSDETGRITIPFDIAPNSPLRDPAVWRSFQDEMAFCVSFGLSMMLRVGNGGRPAPTVHMSGLKVKSSGVYIDYELHIEHLLEGDDYDD